MFRGTSQMQLQKSSAVIACAGAGKTTLLVREALENRDQRIAMVTYTNFNADEIRKKFFQLNSGVPRHVEVMTWFSFLLRECARPYQRVKYPDHRIESIHFVKSRSVKGIPESDTRRHYFSGGSFIYSDKIAKFVVACELLSSGAVTRRLSEIYTHIYIDEFQDLAGWDLDVVELLLRSRIGITLVGDPRQHTYSTNPGPKNSPFLGVNVVKLLRRWEKQGLCSLRLLEFSYRCNEMICEFANRLWPEMAPMQSRREQADEHSGVVLVSQALVNDYIERFRPQVLRYDRRAPCFGQRALNFGAAKGLEFKRVLIVPTARIRNYLRTGEVGHLDADGLREKLYVAVTRASDSVAFVYDGESPIVDDRWKA